MTKIEEVLTVMEGKSDLLYSDALELLNDAKKINHESKEVPPPSKDS